MYFVFALGPVACATAVFFAQEISQKITFSGAYVETVNGIIRLSLNLENLINKRSFFPTVSEKKAYCDNNAPSTLEVANSYEGRNERVNTFLKQCPSP